MIYVYTYIMILIYPTGYKHVIFTDICQRHDAGKCREYRMHNALSTNVSFSAALSSCDSCDKDSAVSLQSAPFAEQPPWHRSLFSGPGPTGDKLRGVTTRRRNVSKSPLPKGKTGKDWEFPWNLGPVVG